MSIIERALGRAKSTGALDHPAESRQPGTEARLADRQKAPPRVFPRELQRINLGSQVLGSAGLSVEAIHERRQTQEFRSVKRALLATLDGSASRNLNLIGVASALSGEGKTYVSFNLARSLAGEVDRSVLLVDADLPKRDLTRSLGLEGRRGLSDYLRDRSLTLADVMLATSIPQLYLMPAGAPGDDSAELLASPRMRELAEQLSGAESGVLTIFDSSPMLLAPDADALLSVVGSV